MAADPPLVPASTELLDALVATARAADEALWGQPETDRDELAHELASIGPLATRSRVLIGPDGVDGAVLLLGTSCRLTLHPNPRSGPRGRVARRLLGWALTAGGDHLDVPAPDTEMLDVADELGFRETHRSYELLRQEAVAEWPSPPGVTLTPLREADLGDAHRMLYDFWADVGTHTDRPLEEWRRLFVDHPGRDPELQLVGRRGGRIIGVGLARVFTGTSGWILQLGVAPTERGRGLGGALLTTLASRLAARPGVSEVGLSVDAANEAALTLYRRAGFRPDREYRRLTRQPQTERRSG